MMLIRIAQGRKVYIWINYFTMGLFFLANSGSLFYIIFQCTPVAWVLPVPYISWD